MNRWMRVVMLLCGALLAVPAAHAARQGNETVMLERLAAKIKQEVRRLDGKNAMLRQRKSEQLRPARFAAKQEKGCVEGVKSAEQDIKLRQLLKQKKQLLRKTEIKLARLNQSASSSKKEMLRQKQHRSGQRVESYQMVAAAEGETGSISGTVTDAAGNPVADVDIYVYTSDYNIIGYTWTAVDGSYTISNLASGSYKVEFDASYAGNYISEWHSDKSSFDAADLVQVTAPDTVTGINAQLATSGSSGSSISGKVTNAGGIPVAGVSVSVYTTDNDYWPVGSAYTEADGSYTVSNLASGSYKVRFFAEDYFTQWFNNQSSFDAADLVQVTAPNAVTGINAQLTTGGSISGKVTNAGGSPVADVYADVYTSDGEYLKDALTDANGNYTVSGLPSGSYKVLFYSSLENSGYLHEWYSDKDSIGAADSVQVTAPNAVTGINAQLTVGASISGKVTNAGGSPVAGVDVYVYDRMPEYDEEGGPTGYAITDANGDYTVSGLRSGSYKVLFDTSWSAGSYLSEWHSDKASFSAATPVQVTAPNAVTGINAELTVGGSISGKVTNADASPVAGVNVTVFSSKEDNCGYYEEAGAAVTDANGDYTVSGLRSGSYKVKFDVAGDSYTSEWHNDKNSFKTAELVQVTAPNAVTGINAQLTKGGSISGKVTNADGSPVAGVEVSVYTSDGSYAGYDYIGISANGNYTVSGLRSGSYKVLFNPSENNGGYLSEWHNDKSSFSAADVVQVTAPDTVTVNAQLATGGSISGTVTNAGGSPVAHVYVYVYNSGGSYAGYDYTGEDGSYTVRGLTSGSYKVQFDASEIAGGYLSEWHNDKSSLSAADVVQVTAPNAVTGINAQLATGGSISGTVTNAGGSPVAYLSIYVYNGDGSYAGYGSTGEDGSYTVSGLSSGSYKVLFDGSYNEEGEGGVYASEWHNDKSSFSAAELVQVTAPNAVTGINAQLATGGSISGRVTDESGMPIVSQSCWWYDDWSSPEVIVKNSSTGETIASGYAGSDGYYSIAGIPPGSYKVLFTAASLGYASQWYDRKDSFNTATIVEVKPSVTVEHIDAALHPSNAAVESIIKTLLLRRK